MSDKWKLGHSNWNTCFDVSRSSSLPSVAVIVACKLWIVTKPSGRCSRPKWSEVRMPVGATQQNAQGLTHSSNRLVPEFFASNEVAGA